MSTERQPAHRKPYAERALINRTRSRRWRAGTRRNKQLRDVGSFKSDRATS